MRMTPYQHHDQTSPNSYQHHAQTSPNSYQHHDQTSPNSYQHHDQRSPISYQRMIRHHLSLIMIRHHLTLINIMIRHHLTLINIRYAVDRYSFDFMMKVDDDTFLNSKLLFDFLYKYMKPKYNDKNLGYYGGMFTVQCRVFSIGWSDVFEVCRFLSICWIFNFRRGGREVKPISAHLWPILDEWRYGSEHCSEPLSSRIRTIVCGYYPLR